MLSKDCSRQNLKAVRTKTLNLRAAMAGARAYQYALSCTQGKWVRPPAWKKRKAKGFYHYLDLITQACNTRYSRDWIRRIT